MAMTPATQNQPSTPEVPDFTRERRRLHTKLKLATQIGQGIDGYIIGGIGMAMAALTADLHLSPLMQGLVGASPLIGIFVGGPLFGRLADRFGRRPVFLVDMLIFLIGSVLQFFVADGLQLFLIRLLMGVAIGGEYAIGAPLLSEYAPRQGRGRLLASLEISWYVGYALATVVGALFAEVDGGWRWSLASSAVIAVVCVALRGGIPESARWLLSKGRREEAEALIEKYGIEVDVDAELEERDAPAKEGFGALFHRRHLRSTVFASVFWAALVLPYFAIGTFWTQVFEALNMGDNAVAALLVYSFTAVAGVTAGCLVVDRIGRRRLLDPAVLDHRRLSGPGRVVADIDAGHRRRVPVLHLPQRRFERTDRRLSAGGLPDRPAHHGRRLRHGDEPGRRGHRHLPAADGTGAVRAEFVLLIGAGVLAVGGLVSQFLAPETTDMDLARAARKAHGA
ncbi:MFS transporter [Streptomyces sp. MS1.AVA.1]|uniref:MFS transporter n=1 Tax=Streptomyces machairae TaxID=3134109 RepID=A0ABU8UFN7_9ACTN